ncbi:hypothetical protein C6P46_003635 [Rhodotorula mucilaginosa]|uniref:Uncharacterized protein n=1 Tax=Rhodotorula mucilaginosa TaxID=5537 RepID=A0A9P7B8T1_RHOMI|nr:hypothetical protein C6P46_003635 [Rhodotorula mucilaginosa]TKA53826.1 hypothetical protein B0A53_03616 [Rhodotorula sp. CCFEE 5036]
MSSTAAGDKAGTSKIARPASRQAGDAPFKPVPPVSGPATRSRIGVQTRATAASAIPRTNRPSSVLGVRPPSSLSSAATTAAAAGKSAIPTAPMRRPSVAAQPTSSSSPPVRAQEGRVKELEAELATANETISSLQNSLAEAEINASSLSAALRSTQSELEHTSDELAQARTDAEVAREELIDVKDEHAVEVAALKQQAEEERSSSVARTQELEHRCAAVESERDELAGSREDLERLLEGAKLEAADYATLEAERDELETELAWHEEELQKVEDAREVDRETIETLRAELEDADNVIGELEKENQRFASQVEVLTGKVSELETAATAEKSRAGFEEDARAVAETANKAVADAEERISALRAELNTRISDVEQERDGLIAALAAASKAHQDAEERVEQARRDHAEAAERAKAKESQTEAAREELSALRSEHDDVKDQLVAAIAEKEALASATIPEAASTFAELPALHAPDVELNDLRARVADLEQQLASSESTVDQLQARLDEIAPPSDAVASLLETTTQRELEDALFDRDEAERELKLAEDRIEELEAELEAARKPDEAEGVDEAVQQRAHDAEARCEALQNELEQLQHQHQHQSLATRAINTEDSEQLAALRAELETERTLTADAKRESAAIEEALMDAKSQLFQLETKLAACEARIQDLVGQHEQDQSRLAQVDELENALQLAEEQLEAVTYELDDLRAQHEDLAQSALQDAAERQAQSDEHDELLELYNRRALETDSLRKILAETEAHADSLAWQLREKESQASDIEKAHVEERDSLLARIAHAEDEQDRLRTELDDAKHRLSDAQDALQHQLAADSSSTSVSVEETPLPRAIPATPSPLSPGSMSFALSPSTDPVALLLRLREERDELRERLDFARNEAKHRTDDLQDRLRRLGESNAQDVSLLQLDLMDKQALYETEREMNVKLEQAVRDAKQQREELSEAAENASRRLRDAEMRIQDLTFELAEGQKQLGAARRDEEELEQLQATLATAHQAMETAQAEAAVAKSQLEQLQTLLDSAEEVRDNALRLAEQREEAINTLQSHLAELEAKEVAPARDPLVELASLCDALPSEGAGIHNRIAELESTLRQYESRIALLQLNLAMRVAIDDDDEEQGDASIERDADATFVAEASDEILSIRQQLAATTLERDTLFTRLQATLDELDAAVRQREQVVGQKLDLEQELGEVRADAKAANDELAVARADVKELAQRTAAYANEVEAVRTRAAQIERIAAAAEDRTEVLERELADVVQLRVDYEVRGEELAQARAQAEGHKSALASGEQELERLVDDLAAAGRALEDARNELAASHESQADVEARLTALNQEATERAEHLTSEIDQARRNSAERELYLEQIQQRVNDLERELSHAAAQLESADQRSSSAEQRIARLDSELELSARENQTLRRLGQSSVAEAEALAAEVAGLKHELQQAHAAKQAELKAAHEEATRNLTEVITELEKRERGQLAAEDHARQLEVELEHARAASHGPSPQDQARIAELEKLLDARMLDVEEADEKLIDALKVQKKSAAMVERLKAKIASLQRDLAAAKSTPAPVVLAAAPLPDAAATTPSAGKKRPAPTEFDSKTASQPRAISQAPPLALDKENVNAGSGRKVQRPLSAIKPAPVDKSATPLPGQAPRRDALSHIDENAGAIAARPAEASTDKIAALNARLQHFRRPKSAEINLS